MRKKAFRFCAGIVGILLIASVLAYGLYTHRPQPPNIRQKIFRGVTYERVSFRNPRPMVVHIITVDLKASQAKFFTTPPVSGLKYPYRAQPVSDFLQKNKLQLAINADFFKPSWSHGPWDYYPHRGDPVYARSLSMHQGKVITPAARHQPSLYFSKDGVPSFEPGPHPYDAISGESIFLRGGRWTLRDPDKDGWRTSIQPRNCIGLSADGSRLLILVVDGRQPGYSEGATLKELAKIALDYGADTMLDLDGGGSETLVMEDKSGQPTLLNCPIDSWIPNRERPVCNQLGLYLQRLP